MGKRKKAGREGAGGGGGGAPGALAATGVWREERGGAGRGCHPSEPSTPRPRGWTSSAPGGPTPPHPCAGAGGTAGELVSAHVVDGTGRGEKAKQDLTKALDSAASNSALKKCIRRHTQAPDSGDAGSHRPRVYQRSPAQSFSHSKKNQRAPKVAPRPCRRHRRRWEALCRSALC